MQGEFLDLRHDRGASPRFHSPPVFMEIDLAHCFQQPALHCRYTYTAGMLGRIWFHTFKIHPHERQTGVKGREMTSMFGFPAAAFVFSYFLSIYVRKHMIQLLDGKQV